MSVKRYDIEAYLYYDDCRWETTESVDGDFVYASDYNELRERVAWMIECADFLDGVNEDNKDLGLMANVYLQDARKSVEELL